ncbi:MAG: SAM-dependent chlorinase/fluorinase [Acidimicrobiales bacterium]
MRAGGLALARSVQYLAPGIVLGVVDPGVGSERKAIAIEVGDGQAYLVGPDNGLFAPAVSMIGGASRAAVLDNAAYHLPAIGATFDGRDVFAPVAAHLCNGVPLDEVGTLIDPNKLLPGVLAVSEKDDDGVITAEVLWIDRYGNVQLNVDPADIDAFPAAVRVTADGVNRTAQKVTTFGEIPTGSIGVLADSYGLLALCVDRGSAAMDLRLAEGDSVKLAAAEASGHATKVQLTSKPARTLDGL